MHPLASATLVPAIVPAGRVWHHIFRAVFPDPLGFGRAPSRFSDPRLPPEFGIYYVGASFETAFLETIVRDLKNGNPGPLLLSAARLDTFIHVTVTNQAPLTMVDLRGGLVIALGVPTDAVRASAHGLGQQASLAVYQRPEQLDGIWYPSRLNGGDNLAVYDRAVSKLAAGPSRKLTNCPELASILTTYRIDVV